MVVVLIDLLVFSFDKAFAIASAFLLLCENIGQYGIGGLSPGDSFGGYICSRAP